MTSNTFAVSGAGVSPSRPATPPATHARVTGSGPVPVKGVTGSGGFCLGALEAIPLPATVMAPVHDDAGRVCDFLIVECNTAAARLDGIETGHACGARLRDRCPELAVDEVFDALAALSERPPSDGDGLVALTVPAGHREGETGVSIRAARLGSGTRLLLCRQPHVSRTRLAAELAAERHTVLELQRAILPLHTEPIDLPGLQATVKYLPAERASRVGGDWYITAELPDRRVLVAIGDVGGHGLPAAAGMARLRGALAGLAVTGSPPDRLVGWLNDLVRHVAPEHTASVIAGYYDAATRTLTWAQAGHPPPVLVRAASARALDPPCGILLGASSSAYGAATTQLQGGDLLLLYSDGLVERRDRPLEDGLRTLTLAASRAGDPEQIISAILQGLGSTDPEDDTCLIALEIK